MARTVAMFTDVSLCIGCRYCVSACPFGVVSFNHDTGTATKCTFCNDRLHNGLGPACAKACPTESIRFGFRDELEAKARKRVDDLQKMGYKDAQLYGADQGGPLGGPDAFVLFLGKPGKDGPPEHPKIPPRNGAGARLRSTRPPVPRGPG